MRARSWWACWCVGIPPGSSICVMEILLCRKCVQVGVHSCAAGFQHVRFQPALPSRLCPCQRTLCFCGGSQSCEKETGLAGWEWRRLRTWLPLTTCCWWHNALQTRFRQISARTVHETTLKILYVWVEQGWKELSGRCDFYKIWRFRLHKSNIQAG